MEKRILGKTGLEVSALGFGGWEIGFANLPPIETAKLLNGALDMGVSLIDTAAAYFHSEEMIGEALAPRRREFVLLSKCGALEGFTREDWSKKGVLETIERSLKLLKTDHLDVAQLHSPSVEILRRADCIEGLIRAQERGLTRFVGISGDNETAAFALGLDFFDTLQISVSIADQQPIETNIRLAKEKGLGIIAKRPVANAVWRHAEKPADSYYHDYWERLEKLRYSFLGKSLEETVSIALRFTLAIDGIASAIVGTTNLKNLQNNAKNLKEGNLSAKEFAEIREIWSATADADWVGKT